MLAIYKREFKSYMCSVYGPIYISVMLLVSGFFTLVYNYLGRSSGLEYTIGYFGFGLMVLVPVLCMRSIAEEKKTGTIQLLYALPLKMFQIVLGKYLALLTIIGIPVLVMAFYPIILSTHGSVYYLKAYVSLVMFFLLGAALAAICMFLSSITESMVISAVLGVAVCLGIYLMSLIAGVFPTSPLASFIAVCALCVLVGLVLFLLSKNWIAGVGGGVVCLTPAVILFLVKKDIYEALFPKFLNKLALFSMVSNLAYGNYKLSTLIAFLSVIVFFVFLTVVSLEKKRWA